MRLYHDKEGTSATLTVYFLEGTLRLRAETRLVRDEGGKLSIHTLIGGRKLESRKRTPAKKGASMIHSDTIKSIVEKVHLSELGFSMTIGIAQNAAITAQLCGLALAVLENAAGLLRRLKPGARVLMRSAPVFGQDCLKVRFSCIASIKLGQAILIALRFTGHILKGAIQTWRTRLKASCAPPWKTSKI